MKQGIKQAVMWLYCKACVPAWLVRVAFAVFRLRSE